MVNIERDRLEKAICDLNTITMHRINRRNSRELHIKLRNSTRNLLISFIGLLERYNQTSNSVDKDSQDENKHLEMYLLRTFWGLKGFSVVDVLNAIVTSEILSEDKRLHALINKILKCDISLNVSLLSGERIDIQINSGVRRLLLNELSTFISFLDGDQSNSEYILEPRGICEGASLYEIYCALMPQLSRRKKMKNIKSNGIKSIDHLFLHLSSLESSLEQPQTESLQIFANKGNTHPLRPDLN